MSKFYHMYHLVSESPWPLMSSFSMLFFMIGVIEWFNDYNMNMMVFSYVLILFNMIQWWRDVVRESTLQGCHTIKVYLGVQLGMILFILSEVMFFFSFFWSYFHMFLAPSVEIGHVWPSVSVVVFNIYNIPLLNTLILLGSGVTITCCHFCILNGDNKNAIYMILSTIMLGLIFVYFQFMEYMESFFSIADSVYGSVFFMLTGFHGLHVMMGVYFITISYLRLNSSHYSCWHHFGFEAASWYWHFVDVVWLFLFLFVYWLSY